MGERKALSKKIRFEVFKRDSFRCQYCGRSAPDVILEVDHITPVAKGGKNDVMNLITSCRDCNRGKGKKLLTDDEIVAKQKAQLDELNEKREQMEMMIKWKTELRGLESSQVEAINDLIKSLHPEGWGLSEHGKLKIIKLLKRFTFQEIYEATETAFTAYNTETEVGFSWALDKIGGICYNRRKQRYAENGNL